MTIPQQPPDTELPDPEEPGSETPWEEPIPGDTPEYPTRQEPEWRAPGAPEHSDIPLRAPSESPDAETTL
jgi:hypothetical protein